MMGIFICFVIVLVLTAFISMASDLDGEETVVLFFIIAVFVGIIGSCVYFVDDESEPKEQAQVEETFEKKDDIYDSIEPNSKTKTKKEVKEPKVKKDTKKYSILERKTESGKTYWIASDGDKLLDETETRISSDKCKELLKKYTEKIDNRNYEKVVEEVEL